MSLRVLKTRVTFPGCGVKLLAEGDDLRFEECNWKWSCWPVTEQNSENTMVDNASLSGVWNPGLLAPCRVPMTDAHWSLPAHAYRGASYCSGFVRSVY